MRNIIRDSGRPCSRKPTAPKTAIVPGILEFKSDAHADESAGIVPDSDLLFPLSPDVPTGGAADEHNDDGLYDGDTEGGGHVNDGWGQHDPPEYSESFNAAYETFEETVDWLERMIDRMNEHCESRLRVVADNREQMTLDTAINKGGTGEECMGEEYIDEQGPVAKGTEEEDSVEP